MKRALAMLLVVCVAAPLSAAEIPRGDLGPPLGTYLKIEGVRAVRIMKDSRAPKIKDRQALEVDTVNGKKLKRPIHIAVNNADLGVETRYVLSGYETGRMSGGLPDEVENSEREFVDKYGIPQAGWHFQIEFVVTSVVEPKGVQLRKEKDGLDFVVGEEAQNEK